jgi:RNA polymerase sigma factor (sigma-70 family)
MNGTDLLSDFKESQSEAAFTELARRYTNLVYSIARRRLTNSAQAQEVTQTVFIRLASAAPKLRSEGELIAWLHRTATNLSIDLWRSESRRRAREEHAFSMQSETVNDAVWSELSPVLDEALNELNDSDRRAILLRFFDDKTMRDIGLFLGVSEDAAKMRVGRAINKLRQQLSARGVACGAVALETLLQERSVEAAPVGVAASLAMMHLAMAPILPAPAGGSRIAAGIVKTKLAWGIAGLVIATTTILLLERNRTARYQPVEQKLPQTVASANARKPDSPDGGIAGINSGDQKREPNPVILLQAIARAREEVRSGEIEFDVAHYEFDRPLDGTNYIHLKAIFDGEKLRFESSDREYSYVKRGDDVAEITDAKRQELGLSPEDAVVAGLLEGFESRHVKTFDGSILMDFWTHDGKRFQTEIKDPSDGSGYYLFDPRTFGIARTFSQGETVPSCLAFGKPVSVKLIGTELLNGTQTWHVQIDPHTYFKSDFWIDIDCPFHVIKLLSNGHSIVSKFDAGHPEDVLPLEVTSLDFNGRKLPRTELRLNRRKTQLNVHFDSSLWTLAGLNMPVGTVVSDRRIHRSIGYWTGSGLSENIPRNTDPKDKTAPKLAEMLALIENDPTSTSALDAATWIILNTPDGPHVDKAADVIIREHIQNPDLSHFAEELMRVRPRSSSKLLETMIENNPNVDARAAACFSLGMIRKDEADYGVNVMATEEAIKLFDRVVREFGTTSADGAELARRAKPELYELRKMIIGKPAPEIDAETMDGGKVKLSALRGKVVVVVFWFHGYSEINDHRKLMEHAAGKPFTLVGINCDNTLAEAKSFASTNQMSWPNIWDGRSGPISKAWNINSWTSVLVLDRKGVIRYRGFRQGDLTKAVDALLLE